MSQYASKDDMIGAMRKRIAELESELEAIGAGGVSGPLIGRASLSANAGEPRALTEDQWLDLAERHANADWDSGRPDGFMNAVKALCLDYAAPPTAQAEGWTKASEQLPPCRDEQLYIGVNSVGYAGVFNAVASIAGNVHCMYETAEGSTDVMSDLAIWKPFNPPTSAEGVEHG